jgi:hypothetical protein
MTTLISFLGKGKEGGNYRRASYRSEVKALARQAARGTNEKSSR